jgi:hypothetical protein
VESKIHKLPHQRRKGRRLRHRRTYPGTDQDRQVCKTQPKQLRTTGTRTLVAVPYISTNHLYTKHILKGAGVQVCDRQSSARLGVRILVTFPRVMSVSDNGLSKPRRAKST